MEKAEQKYSVEELLTFYISYHSHRMHKVYGISWNKIDKFWSEAWDKLAEDKLTTLTIDKVVEDKYAELKGKKK